MDEPPPLAAARDIAPLTEFLPLTDSLASRIRWRACDYAALFSAELELMLSSGSSIASVSASGTPRLRSTIRLLQCDAFLPEGPVRSALTTPDLETSGKLEPPSTEH